MVGTGLVNNFLVYKSYIKFIVIQLFNIKM